MNESQILNALTIQSLEARRAMLSERLRATFSGVVAYGHLKGVNINQQQTWGHSADLGAKLLGLYEREVLDAIFSAGRRYECLVNLGAGDGYYGVGLVKAGIAAQSICFESNAGSRGTLRACATANGVSDRVRIEGTAGGGFLQSDVMQGVDLSKSLFVIDIEGGEFTLLTEGALAQLRHSELIIELHGAFVDRQAPIEDRFISLLQKFFHCTLLTTGPRDLSSIKEVAWLSDTDRWLICSEGRPCLMRWAHCVPLHR